MPEEQAEAAASAEMSQEDAAIRDRRLKEASDAIARADLKRQSQVVQRGLPRPSVVDVDAMLKNASDAEDPIKQSIGTQMALLIANDARKFGGARVKGSSRPVEMFEDDEMQRARLEIALEMGKEDAGRKILEEQFGSEWQKAHEQAILPGLAGYAEDELDEHQLMTEAFDVCIIPSLKTMSP